MTALVAAIAVVLDWVLGEPRRWHPLVGFGHYASWLERVLHRDGAGPEMARGAGVLAVWLATAPVLVACLVAMRLPGMALVLPAAVLYFALGHRSLDQHARRVERSLRQGDLVAARRGLAMMVSRDTASLDAAGVAAATVESVLENGNDAVFGALFWFALLGAPGALLFRLVNTLDAMWGYRTPRYLYFGWAAARLDDALNWVPARLTAVSYALIGHTAAALRCWRTQAPAWDSPNAGPVMAAGAGSLQLQLGGAACYHGALRQRPVLGIGARPGVDDIWRALGLVRAALLLWLLVLAVAVYLHA
jgi:adenosylcobinamide-phosphate synthase